MQAQRTRAIRRFCVSVDSCASRSPSGNPQDLQDGLVSVAEGRKRLLRPRMWALAEILNRRAAGRPPCPVWRRQTFWILREAWECVKWVTYRDYWVAETRLCEARCPLQVTELPRDPCRPSTTFIPRQEPSQPPPRSPACSRRMCPPPPRHPHLHHCKDGIHHSQMLWYTATCIITTKPDS